MAIYNYDRKTFLDDVKEFFCPADVLVDIGCGVVPQKIVQTTVHICIEPFRQYIEAVRGFCPSSANFIFLNVDAVRGLSSFADLSVDTVCLIDVIEHMEKEVGLQALEEAERVARRQIIVFTPYGYMAQNYHEGDNDAWGMDGSEFQVHKSGWLPEDFIGEWDFHICNDFHKKEELHIEVDRDYGAFYAVHNRVFGQFLREVEPPGFVVDDASPLRKLRSCQKYPLVSIVIPVYNGANFIKEAIDSALSQSYRNVEVVVVNDGSVDDTSDIVQGYGDKIRYYEKSNGGVASALNFAIEKAHGSYISWLSHDDLYSENKIERQVEELARRGGGDDIILFSDYRVIDLLNNKEYDRHLSKELMYRADGEVEILKVLFSSSLHGCSLLIPKAAFTRMGGFDENLATTQDYTLWYQLVKEGYRFVHIDEPLIAGRLHKDQGTQALASICIPEIRTLLLWAADLFTPELVLLPEEEFVFFEEALLNYKLYKGAKRLRQKRNVSHIKRRIASLVSRR